MTEYKALVDLVVANKFVAAGETFSTIEAQVEPALSFGLVEVVKAARGRAADEKDEPKAKPAQKRTTRKASS